MQPDLNIERQLTELEIRHIRHQAMLDEHHERKHRRREDHRNGMHRRRHTIQTLK